MKSSGKRFLLFLTVFLAFAAAETTRAADDGRGNIKEDVPAKYQGRFQAWKREFLAAPMGREQWDAFLKMPRFTLTISISRENPQGAGTGNYKWDDKGRLVAATVTLGYDLNNGYPSPVYYPVMNSLAGLEFTAELDNNILAATKLAHEFGHLRNVVGADATLFQLQNETMPLYNKIFLSNGRRINDARLLDLAGKMGGTPVEIWEDREYWGEANAMLYLRDRLKETKLRCSIFRNIRQRVDLYASRYGGRFADVAQSAPLPHCGW